MADYLIQDTTLDAIANAINAKTGGSSAMTPAQMVQAIGTISGGGGSLPSPITHLATGSFTLAEDVTSYELTHNLGVVPQLIFVWCSEFETYTLKDLNTSSTSMIAAAQVGNVNKNANWIYCSKNISSVGNTSTSAITYAENDISSTAFKIHGVTMKSTLTTSSGTSPATWRWLAVAVSS